MLRKIYVQQFGYWWSFSPSKWESMLKDMLIKDIDMDDYGKQLKYPPYKNLITYKSSNDEGYFYSQYISIDEDKYLVYNMVCDWDTSDIEFILQEIKNII